MARLKVVDDYIEMNGVRVAKIIVGPGTARDDLVAALDNRDIGVADTYRSRK